MTKGSLIEKRVAFLGRPPEELRAVRGRDLYETLQSLGLGHGVYFKAVGTTADQYCAEEFGIDLGTSFSSPTRTRSGCFRTSCATQFLWECATVLGIRSLSSGTRR